MNRGDEMAANMETAERQSAGGAAGPDKKSDQQLHTILENLGRVAPQDELHSGLTPRLDLEALERKSISDRLPAIENQAKKRGSPGFSRNLLAICIGVAATLAWQSYGEAAKQIFAAKAPELGWSSETKQMIANWVEQLGWTKPPQAGPLAQTAPTAVAPSVPVAPSIDPAEVHQIAKDVTALRQAVAQITASQDQMAREVGRLQAANQEILVKTPEPPPPPPIAAAPAVAPGVAPSPANTALTSASLALRASCGPDVQRLCRGISIENVGVIKCLSSHRMELSPTCDAYFKGMPAQRAAQTKPKPVTPPSSRAPVPPYIPPHP
jgi:outer membrane murein-binding lipoprotein Lpp